MAKKLPLTFEGRRCLTPDAQYHFSVNEKELSVTITFPKELNLSEQDATELQELTHNAMESVLAPFWHQLDNESEQVNEGNLLSFITESRAFRNEEMVEKYSTKELGEIFFAMMLSIQLVSQHEETKRYCIKTLKFPKFDHIFLSSTDLANVITTLRNAKELLGQTNIELPVNEIKRYLRGLVLGGNTPAFVRALFFRIQQRLRLKDGHLITLRRELVDGEGHGDDLTYGRPLYAYLRKYQNKCDVLALLQTLMDRYMVESSK